MKLKLEPGAISGTVQALPSKSQLHRLLICAALSGEETRLICRRNDATDIRATVNCLCALGARIENTPSGFRVLPIDRSRLPEEVTLDCADSGATLRFLLPVACSLGVRGEFHMQGRLPLRPMKELEDQLTARGCTISRPSPDTLRFSGRLCPGDFALSGGESSQFLSGLILALAGLSGESKITLQNPVVSRAYVDMTLAAVQQFGGGVTERDGGFFIPGGFGYRSPGELAVEGDWANAAVWLCAAALPGGKLRVKGLDHNSLQAERTVIRILRDAGAKIEWQADELVVFGAACRAFDCDADAYPDIVPALAAFAANCTGGSVLRGLSRLRLKESDRFEAIVGALRALGVAVSQEEDTLRIQGTPLLSGGEMDGCGDHRIAMMAAVLAAGAKDSITVSGAEAVSKSDPDFWKQRRALSK